MLNEERAGTLDLKEFYQRKKKEIVARQGHLGRSLSSARLVRKEQEAEFFSNWELQSVHAALQIEGLQSLQSLAEFLRLPDRQVKNHLQKLESFGLIAASQNGWKCLQPFVHFHGDDPTIRQRFHLGWRLKSLERNFAGVSANVRDTVCFSSLITLDVHARKEIVREIKDMVQRVSQRAKNSDSKGLSVLNLDFFSLEQAE